MLERVVEEYLRQRVRQLGGMCVKLAPTIAGIPDRMVILPGEPIRLVELKRPKGGRVSMVQLEQHKRLAELGHVVPVLWSKEDVDQWLALR